MLADVRRPLQALALVLLLSHAVPAAAAAARPNVLVIETDDQTAADMAAMPYARAQIGGRGTTFANSVVSLSQCCPSRATLLTGRYAHNHGVLDVRGPLGGYARLDGSETLPVWLRRAGYATGVVGKCLNGYSGRAVPPGWGEFHVLPGRSTYRFYDYALNENGVLRRFGTAPADYQTDVISGRAEELIRRLPAPWFLWVTYVAPHVAQPRDVGDPFPLPSTVPAPRHRAAFTGAPMPRGAAFDEADVRDKPPAIRRRPRLGPKQEARISETWRQRVASLRAVDEGVARLLGALRAAGAREDTLVIFTSDNGYLLGEHRVPSGKVLPYEPSIRVPLLMRGPGVPRGAVRRDLVWNGDLAPTILEAAGARAPFPLDGRSLLAAPRPDRDVLLEAPPARGTNGLPRFTGLRTRRFTYVEHARGARELYDLRADPQQLSNRARDAPRGVLRTLAGRLAELRGCRGVNCRAPAAGARRP